MPTLPLSRDQLLEGPVRYAGELKLPEQWGAPAGFDLREAPRVALRAEESQDEGIRLTGTLSARLLETCSRCLTEVEREREVPIDVRFEPGLDIWDEGPGLYVLEANREQVDVGPALREELILALPHYPLCRPDCRGLCPQCGTDLDQEECGCVRETGDPRWEALRSQLTPGALDANDDEPQDG